MDRISSEERNGASLKYNTPQSCRSISLLIEANILFASVGLLVTYKIFRSEMWPSGARLESLSESDDHVATRASSMYDFTNQQTARPLSAQRQLTAKDRVCDWWPPRLLM